MGPHTAALLLFALALCCELASSHPLAPPEPRRARVSALAPWERESALVRRLRGYEPGWDDPLPQLASYRPIAPHAPRSALAPWERESVLVRRLRGYEPGWDDPLPESNSYAGRPLARSRRGQSMTPRNFLEKFGYLPPQDDRYQYDAATREHAMKTFQRKYHLSQTGTVDDATKKAMVKPRCGMMDMAPQMPPHMENPLTPENFVVPGYKWNVKKLTWNFRNDFNKIPEMTPDVQKRAIQEALQYWEDASGLEFTETSGPANINLKYCPSFTDHGDGPQNAFDGPSGVLAHAFYPTSGELHLDDSEQWTSREGDQGINLKIVAAHELGHALGLGHSDMQGALMAPFYQPPSSNYRLPTDDKNAIVSLYGQHEAEMPKPLPPVRPDVTPAPRPDVTTKMMVPVPPTGSHPDTCTLSFTAVTQTHDERVYAYSGQWMWRMSDYGLDEGFPVTINTYYEQAPDSIQAALYSPSNMFTWFFKGNEIWRYYGFQLDVHKVVTTRGYPVHIKAALFAPDGTTIYLMQNGNCWKFDENRMDISSSTHVPCTQVFPGVPTSFDSAVRLHTQPDFIYFFHGRNYQKYSEAERKVLSGYPKDKAGPWMGPACGARPKTPK